jgi:hypothetical protein
MAMRKRFFRSRMLGSYMYKQKDGKVRRWNRVVGRVPGRGRAVEMVIY